MGMYSDKVMDHFMNPRNVGALDDADGIGEVGNPVCGDMMTFYVKVEGGRIADVKFKTFGCGAAIAVSSMVSEMALGKTLDEAMEITNESVAEELGGLPKNKLHCSNLGADALHNAIDDYRRRQESGEPAAAPREEKEKQYPDACPYCDEEVSKTYSFCNSCGHEYMPCPACEKLVSSAAARCPHCGVDLGSAGEDTSSQKGR